MNTKETISKYWDWRSESYTNALDGFQAEERSVWNKELRAAVNGNRGLNILDVGTGPGFLALILAEMGHTITGVDISRGMIEKAQNNAKMMGLEADFRHADAERLPFEDESFDFLVNWHLLWTLPNPKETIEEWARVLKPEGAIVAIDGAWFDPALSTRLRRCVSKAVTFAFDKKIPSFYSVFGEYYNPIRHELPLFGDTKPQRICTLFEEAGLSNVSFRYLEEAQRFQRAYAKLPYRIAHNDPTFLVTGKKV